MLPFNSYITFENILSNTKIRKFQEAKKTVENFQDKLEDPQFL